MPVIQDPHDVIVRISYVGVCGSDVHFWKEGGVFTKVSEEKPIVMGHEGSGVVHSVGPAVTTLRPGDKVALEPGVPCRRCKICKAGQYNLCAKMCFCADPPESRDLLESRHGLLAKFHRTPEDYAVKLPDGVALDEAALIEPLAVATHVNRMSGLRAGQSVAVLGSGTIGLLSAAVAKAFGASEVIITDVVQKKLDFAKGYLQCPTFLVSTTASPEENAARITSQSSVPSGFDVILECTGVESSLAMGLHLAAPGGVLIQVGMGRLTQTIPLQPILSKELTIKGAFRYGAGDYDVAVGMVAGGRVSVRELISSVRPFGETVGAWEATMRGEGIKNLIKGVED